MYNHGTVTAQRSNINKTVTIHILSVEHIITLVFVDGIETFIVFMGKVKIFPFLLCIKKENWLHNSIQWLQFACMISPGGLCWWLSVQHIIYSLFCNSCNSISSWDVSLNITTPFRWDEMLAHYCHSDCCNFVRNWSGTLDYCGSSVDQPSTWQ